MMKRAAWWVLPLAGAMVMAGCGGGDGASTPDRQAGQGIAVGEPNPGAPVATAKFITLAQAENCADTHNRLYVIDQKYVFWDRAGRCADAAYAYRLYGNAPEMDLCSRADSIAGPQGRCKDDNVKALFDTMVKNADAADLGLGAGHKVEKISFDGAKPGFTQIDSSNYSRVLVAKDVVIKDANAWAALWHEHAGDDSPVPKVDFSSRMVLAVFNGAASNGCASIGIDSIVTQGGKLRVTYTASSGPTAPGYACAAVITFPAQLVSVERFDGPVEFMRGVPRG